MLIVHRLTNELPQGVTGYEISISTSTAGGANNRTVYNLVTGLWIVAVFFICAAASPTYGISLDGQRIKVKGQWVDDHLQVYKLKFKDPDTDTRRGRVSGRISSINRTKHTLNIGPVKVQWSDKTKFKGLTRSDLEVGVNVKVSGVSKAPGVLFAKRFQPESDSLDDDTIAIDTTAVVIDAQDQNSSRISLMGIPSQIPAGLTSNLTLLTRRQDDRRPGDQAFIEIFGRPLVIGGEVGFNPRYREDFQLDPNRNDDLLRLDQNFQIELFYSWNSELAMFIEGKGNADVEVYQEGKGRMTDDKLERGEMWLFWGDMFGSGLSLQVGHQNFQEPREWWWDENLDALRIYYIQPFFHFELGLTQRLAPIGTDEDIIDPEQEDVFRLLGHSRWEWMPKHFLSLFALYQQDYSKVEESGTIVKRIERDQFDGDITWAGIRSNGIVDLFDHGQLEYWLDTAWVEGRESDIDFDRITDEIRFVDDFVHNEIDGWAVDTGIIWETQLPGNPTFTFGYAIGSPEFRQTGLQNNNNRFRSVDRFRYYGELSRPELANMEIWTVATGFPLLSNSSVEFVYHNYQQVDARPFIRNIRLSDNLNGRNTSIGQEWDLIFGFEETSAIEMEFVFAVFRAGSAYGELEGKTALNFNFKFNYNF